MAWATAATPADPATPPDRVGDARVVVDRASGKVTTWPPLPIDEIIARSTPSPAGRFPDDVETHLRTAGWYPGRTIPQPDIDRYAERLHDLTVDDPPVLGVSGPARDFVAEFGGLTIGVPNKRTWVVHPSDRDPDPDKFAGISTWQGEPVTPVATVLSPDDSELVIALDGRVFVGDVSGVYYLADSPDWAVIRLIRGTGFLPWVDEHDEIHHTDYAGRPIDPGTTRRPG